MAASTSPPEVVDCSHCGRPTLKVDDWGECERCAAYTAGYTEATRRIGLEMAQRGFEIALDNAWEREELLAALRGESWGEDR